MAKSLKRKEFKLNVRSRHPSHSPLKQSPTRLPFRSVVRLGSNWAGDGLMRVECNSVEAVRTSADKLAMKSAFSRDNVITADWMHRSLCSEAEYSAWFDGKFPIVAKHRFGSRGTGNTLLQDQESLSRWLTAHVGNLNNYIFEKFYNYSREYRLHVTREGCFYACRKMLKSDTPENQRWFRNDSNSVWVTEYEKLTNADGSFREFSLSPNAEFDKPVNWDEIVQQAVRALTAVGLDVGAIDVRVQSRTDSRGNVRPRCEFIILETNSAPSFGEITLKMYNEVIPKILLQKQNEKRSAI